MGGTTTKDAGGVPAPTKALKDLRADLTHVLVATLDNCIGQSEKNPEFDGLVPTKFAVTLTASYPQGREITSRPVTIDLAKDIFTQINEQLTQAKDPDATQPPTGDTASA